MEDVGIYYGPIWSNTAVWYVLSPFGMFCGHSMFFSRFGMLYQEKSGNSDNQS
jgi:hypothetical protein